MSLVSVASKVAGAAASTSSSKSAVATAATRVAKAAAPVAAKVSTAAKAAIAPAKPSGPTGVAAIANAFGSGASTSSSSSPAVVKTISAAGQAAAASGVKASSTAAGAAVSSRSATVVKASSIALAQPFKIAPAMDEIFATRSSTAPTSRLESRLEVFAGLLGLAFVGGALLAVDPAQDKSAPTDKVVPNPDGKKGGPGHQAGVKEVLGELEDKYLGQDVQVRPEQRVDTPDGEKSKRYLDAAAVDNQSGQVIEGVQVGKQTQAGNPVSREQRALDDIKAAVPQADIWFRPYNESSGK
jgi:hypothetical protein